MPVRRLATNIKRQSADAVVRECVGQENRNFDVGSKLPRPQSRTDARIAAAYDQKSHCSDDFNCPAEQAYFDEGHDLANDRARSCCSSCCSCMPWARRSSPLHNCHSDEVFRPSFSIQSRYCRKDCTASPKKSSSIAPSCGATQSPLGHPCEIPDIKPAEFGTILPPQIRSRTTSG